MMSPRNRSAGYGKQNMGRDRGAVFFAVEFAEQLISAMCLFNTNILAGHIQESCWQ